MRTIIHGIELDKFTLAYIECALWSTNDNSTPQGGEPLDENHNVEDFAKDALEAIAAECKDFQEANAKLLAQVPDRGREWTVDEQNGHDFWLTRNGHGAGFWDRGYPGMLGDDLTTACRAYGTSDIYIGDDGQLHVS